MRRLGIAAAVALSIFGGQALAGPYSAIYSFGDSYSDVGNYYIATGGAQPASPYFNGVFSNGPNWLQDLAPMLGLPAPTPSSSPSNGNDYAVGGAKSGTTPIYTAGTSDLPAQIQAFEDAHPGGAPSSALYTFEIGANDVLYVLGVLATVPTWDGAEAVLDQAAFNVASEAGILESDGAKTLLLYNVPDLALMPYVDYLATNYNDPTLLGQAAAFSQEFNTLVSQDLASKDAGLSIHTFDAYDLNVKMAANPSAYGLTDVTDACWSGGTAGYAGGGSVCASPGTYLYWDALHPSAAANQFIAEAAFRAVIPEPSTWAMMLIGLAGLGFAGARRGLSNSGDRRLTA